MWNQVGNLGAQGVCSVRLFLFLFFILKALLRFTPSLLPFLPLSHGFVPGRGGREGEALAPRTSRPSDFKERETTSLGGAGALFISFSNASLLWVRALMTTSLLRFRTRVLSNKRSRVSSFLVCAPAPFYLGSFPLP